jgi:hypothetical protein
MTDDLDRLLVGGAVDQWLRGWVMPPVGRKRTASKHIWALKPTSLPLSHCGSPP